MGVSGMLRAMALASVCVLMVGCVTADATATTVPTKTASPTVVPATIEPGQDLEFSTIARWDLDCGWPGSSSGLVVVTSPQETTITKSYVEHDTQPRIERVNYGAHFVVVAFLGWRSSGFPEFEVQRVVRRGDRVEVHAAIDSRDIVRTDIVCSPYHAIEVCKKGEWARDIEFVMLINEHQHDVVEQYVPGASISPSAIPDSQGGD